jgi:hypothetical protein
MTMARPVLRPDEILGQEEDDFQQKHSRVIHRFAWRSVFHPCGLVNDGPSGHRRRRRASRVIDKAARVKKMPPSEQWLNNEAGG